jgi:hypothetical protein
MPDADDYAKYPEHVLNGVEQAILDAARRATNDAADVGDLDPELAHPLADAVVLRIIEAGYVIYRGDLRGVDA